MGYKTFGKMYVTGKCACARPQDDELIELFEFRQEKDV